MIIAGIVTYNPDLSRLEDNIKSIQEQVDKVVVFDNNSKNFSVLKELLERYQIELIRSKTNIGLGAALNTIFKKAIKEGAVWVVTLDQDSICQRDYIHKASRIMDDNRVGIVVPIIVDHNLKQTEVFESDKTSILKKCITSASIVRASVYELVGGYDDYMFVDYVDFDFSIRVTLSGYKIICIHNSILNHELGKSTTKKILFWSFRYTEHDARREYLIARNIIIYINRYWKYINVTRDMLSICKHFVLVTAYDSNKKEKIKALCKGIRDGFRYKGN